MGVYTRTPKAEKEDGNKIAGHTVFNEPLEQTFIIGYQLVVAH